MKISIKIANKLSTCLFKINSTFIAKLDKINNDLNNKLNKEINVRFGKINTKLASFFFL